MSERRNVQLVQVNFQYGQNVFVPYSVGSIQAYAETVPEVKSNFQFADLIFLRADPRRVAAGMDSPAVVGISCYLWNWEYNISLAKAVRAAHPDALIVFGGTHTPNASQGFFAEHPYVDLLVHHEGELAFADILIESLSDRPDYTKIPGLSVRVEGNATLKTTPRGRIAVGSLLPSPYLAGVFDFMLGRGYQLSVSQETNRGCPYECTFCDWGGATYAKVIPIDEARILAEFEWFGRHKAEYLFSCDANYGILPRDLRLTEKMVEVRARHDGFPRKFRMCTAKNSNDKIFSITKILADAGMNKGATLSFQSMDDNTLGIIKRKNIKIDKFDELMNRYQEEGIATYTELILGMPGETYESAKRGMDTLLNGQADTVNLYVHPCTRLPNSEMNEPGYAAAYGIKSVRMPILLGHSTPEPESLTEYNEVIVETSAMPREDWRQTFLFSWAIQGFHCLGLTQHIAILFHKHGGLKYSTFYEKFLDYFTTHRDTLVGGELALTMGIVTAAQEGGRLDRVLPRFGPIYWPLEEASFLNLVADKARFYDEVRSFIGTLAGEIAGTGGEVMSAALLDDLILYESARMIDPHKPPSAIELRYDLHDYFSRLRDPAVSLQRLPTRLLIDGEIDLHGDLEKYAREILWYGRKGGKFHRPVVPTAPH